MPPISQIKISVIINNYNYARFLGECIRSALDQAYPNKEIIVVDDGSTDNSREVIEKFGGAVRTVYKANAGQASALNAGYSHSSGDLVIFLDADDYLNNGALSCIASAWRPGLAKIHWRLKKIDYKGNYAGVIPKYKWNLSCGNVARQQAERGLVVPPTSGNAFSRIALSALMPIPEALFKICADQYLMTRIPFYGAHAAIDKTLATYRMHGGNNFANKRQLKLSSHKDSLQRALYLNQQMTTDAKYNGLPVKDEVVFRNSGALLSRAHSYILDPINHQVPNDSLYKIFSIATAGIVSGAMPGRVYKLRDALALLILIARLKLKSCRRNSANIITNSHLI